MEIERSKRDRNSPIFLVHEAVEVLKTEMDGLLERKNEAYRRLENREADLRRKSADLEEMNVALKQLVKRMNDDRAVLEKMVLSNLTELIYPFLEKLERSNLDRKQKEYVDIISTNLSELASSFATDLESKDVRLSPSEIQVANLVKQGRRSKEIAVLLNISIKTVEAHRESIRRKLGIKNKKVNLRAFLIDRFN